MAQGDSRRIERELFDEPHVRDAFGSREELDAWV